jgi:hypothetical protein
MGWAGLERRKRQPNTIAFLFYFYLLLIAARKTRQTKRRWKKKKNNTVCQVMNEAVQQKCQEVAWQQLELPQSKSC